MRGLVVDDSRAIRMFIIRMLRELGFDDCTEAGHGVEALARLDEFGLPDVMLVDWNMPEMDGLELIRAVRADPDRCRLPIVMVATETEVAQVVRALAAGASEYVMKPFTKELISDKLDLLGLLDHH